MGCVMRLIRANIESLENSYGLSTYLAEPMHFLYRNYPVTNASPELDTPHMLIKHWSANQVIPAARTIRAS